MFLGAASCAPSEQARLPTCVIITDKLHHHSNDADNHVPLIVPVTAPKCHHTIRTKPLLRVSELGDILETISTIRYKETEDQRGYLAHLRPHSKLEAALGLGSVS